MRAATLMMAAHNGRPGQQTRCAPGAVAIARRELLGPGRGCEFGLQFTDLITIEGEATMMKKKAVKKAAKKKATKKKAAAKKKTAAKKK
ncbi:hypothetical protein L6R21_08505 [bacterium]|nr:hypothetical protein [bacterium]